MKLILFILLSFAGFLSHAQVSLTFNVDMSQATNFDPSIHEVYLSGAKSGAVEGIGGLPVWPIPGSQINMKMSPISGGSLTYTLTFNDIEAGAYEYKYFLVQNGQVSWNLGEWGGTNNRVVVVTNQNVTTSNVWGVIENTGDVDLRINEILASNGSSIFDEDGDYSDWIEIYNAGNDPVNLMGFGLSDDENFAFKWTFPSVFILPNQYLIVWASGKNRAFHNQPLHTSFSLSSSGETLILSDQNGVLLSTLPAAVHQSDIAFGRFPNASNNVVYLTNPTPYETNSGAAFASLSSPLVFSIPEGYYTNSIQVTISSADPQAQIRYTLDGSEPTQSSPLYMGPISLNDVSNLPNGISMIPTNFSSTGPPYFEGWQEPNGLVNKINVLRAKSFNPERPPAVTQTATYLIGPEGSDRYSLPVFSLATNNEFLFDDDLGMYVPGSSGNNFFQDWERPGNLTLFLRDGTRAFNENIGYSIHGNYSRNRPKKSLRISFRGQYGSSWLDYPIFENSKTERYKRFILRNSGNDWGNSLIRDGYAQVLSRSLKVEFQHFQPAILFINGEYWGTHNLRDRYNTHYFEAKYGIESTQLTVLEFNAEYKFGNFSGVWHYEDLLEYMEDHDLSEEIHYKEVQKRMDTESFTDMLCAQIFSKNTDWPGNNLLYWRYVRDGYDSTAGVRDGRWRWMLLDMDFAFDLDFSYVPFINQGVGHNTLAFALEEDGDPWPNPAWSTFVFRNLAKNQSFENYFVNRYCDLLNTIYKPGHAVHVLDSIKSLLLPEMQENIDRWRSPETLASWEQQVLEMRSFVALRAESQFGHLDQVFGVGPKRRVTIDIDETQGGYVRLNTINLRSETDGISDPVYPWQGFYMSEVPLTLQAIPLPGFEFSHWSGALEGSNPNEMLVLDSEKSVKAHFKAIPQENFEVIHFWFFGTQLENDTPLIAIAPSKETGFAQLEFHSCLDGYPFIETHPNWRLASMERRNDPTEINYSPEGNSEVPYTSANMRGIQIREPMQFGDRRNEIVLKFSTKDYEHLSLRFAARDEGATQGFEVTYRNPQLHESFLTNPLPNSSTQYLPQDDENYHLYEFSFHNIEEINDADTVEFRIRFMSTNPLGSTGDRVNLNNICISGARIQEEEPEPAFDFSIYPNPGSANIQVVNKAALSSIEIYDLTGKQVKVIKTVGNTTLNVSDLSQGVYLFHVVFSTGERRTVKFVRR